MFLYSNSHPLVEQRRHLALGTVLRIELSPREIKRTLRTVLHKLKLRSNLRVSIPELAQAVPPGDMVGEVEPLRLVLRESGHSLLVRGVSKLAV